MSRTTSMLIILSVFAMGQVRPNQALTRPGVGDVAPALHLANVVQGPDLDGINWKALKGKVVVLEFWATWCGPCIEAIPHLNELADHFEGKPVQFISIAKRDSLSRVKKLLHNKPMKGWVVLDEVNKTSAAYGARSIPHTAIIDKDGKVVGSFYPKRITEHVLQNIIDGKPPFDSKPKPPTNDVEHVPQ